MAKKDSKIMIRHADSGEEICLNKFVGRQTSASPYTHFIGSDADLIRIVTEAMKSDCITPGYRDGVVLVSVPVEGFYTGLVTLKDGDKLVGHFESRTAGEQPRKTVFVNRDAEMLNAENPNPRKVQARLVQVVCYSHEVLLEDGDNDSDCPWEIVSINGYPTVYEAPIEPNTLMHNHFGSDGGTATGMTPEMFEKALRESFQYWKNKAHLV